VLPEERELGGLFIVDINLWLSLKKAIESDNLADTVSFADTFRFVSLDHDVHKYQLCIQRLNYKLVLFLN